MQKKPQLFPQNLTAEFLASASGWYGRAVRNLMSQVKNTNLEDVETCRILNNRIMTVRLSELLVSGDSPSAGLLSAGSSRFS